MGRRGSSPHGTPGVRIAPHLAADWLYFRVVWGGLWGFLFMLPLVRGHWWLRRIILSLGPSAFQMLYVFPRRPVRAISALASAR
jgi:hypothetical protein